MTSARSRIADTLGLERNILAVSVAVCLLALGKKLWKRFPEGEPGPQGLTESPVWPPRLGDAGQVVGEGWYVDLPVA